MVYIFYIFVSFSVFISSFSVKILNFVPEFTLTIIALKARDSMNEISETRKIKTNRTADHQTEIKDSLRNELAASLKLPLPAGSP